MKHLNAEKYSLAWFKLAECVSRKEKERSLGVYRLLSHSLDNDALAAQLFGDLLLCFEDYLGAVQKYLQATELYKKNNQLIEAIAVCEHIVTLQPKVKEYLFNLCDLYVQIDMSFKIVDHIKLLLQNQQFDLVDMLLQKYNNVLVGRDLAMLNQVYFFALLKTGIVLQEKAHSYIEKIIDLWSQVDDDYMLSEFLNTLKTVEENFYLYALEYIE